MTRLMRMKRSELFFNLYLFLISICLVCIPVEGTEEANTIFKDGEKCVNGICYNEEDLQKDVLPEVSSCTDLREKCTEWAEEGLCETNWKYMHPHCPKTCNVCHNRTREVPESESFAPKKRRWAGDHVILDAIGADIGKPQVIKNLDEKDALMARVEEARDYIENTVMVDDRYKMVRDLCRNYDESCTQLAIQGHCEKSKGFMHNECAPVCFTCEQLHIEARCPIDPAMKNAWYRGDLNRMFERIMSDHTFQQYSPTVLSRPYYAPGDTRKTADYERGPWIVVLEDFVTPEECERLIQLGGNAGYKRSTEENLVPNEYGGIPKYVSEIRTSTNSWCREGCRDDPLVVQVMERMENLTGIPRSYSEDLQLLRYEEGQFYEQHHDYTEMQIDRMYGVRILTVFLYLNDVEEGGETGFPDLDLMVQPKLGRALLWPSVLNKDPNEPDLWTEHESLPVVKGIKYGANAWFHQREFQYAAEIGCDM